MTAKLRSIQGEREKTTPTKYLPCKAFRKHTLDGHVVQEKVDRKFVWIARLECSVCGTHRIDVMKPKTCELISRLYIHPDDYDASITPAEARVKIYQAMLEGEMSMAEMLAG